MARLLENSPSVAAFIRRLRYFLWPPPEPELAHAGREGEIVIAKGRLFVVSLLLLPALASCLRAPSEPSGWIALGMALLCIAIGLEILRRVRAAQTGGALQTFTTLLDISLVSVYHVLLFLAGQVDMVFNSRVTFALYVIAISGTALRYNGQLVRLAGLTATIQYLAIIVWANATLRIAASGSVFYGDTSLGGQAEEVCMLLIATTLGAIIVERGRQLRLSGIRDPLTKLANRSYFFERFQLELQRASRAGQTIAVAMIDLDHFKQVNDTYGHTAGDLVLKQVASELRHSLDRNAVVARLGGEEFAVLLNDSSAEAAREKLEAFRVALRSRPIRLNAEAGVRVTASMGIAVFPTDGDETERLLEVADARLLVGKRAGRDVLVASG